ncbi:Rv1733c family protein [Nocardia cyriacigeorgica]|uniref:Rv1733c family protein n=1 Tax=Nocardia cyriacigeorgica TaxID=135487 RepID=UPI00245783DC|nr:hypothetical protein [Nocardia cyriacigeorgica]
MADGADARTRADIAAWWCRRPWNPNPLLRSADRAVLLLRMVVLGAVLLALPLALTIGTQIYTDDAARVRAEQAAVTAVDATVLTEPVWSDDAHDFTAQVRWDTRDQPQTATIPVARRTEIGDRVAVWLDDAGAPTDTPRHPVTAAFAGIGAAVLIWTVTCLIGFGLIRGAVLLSDRRHATQWDREWVRFDKPVTGDMS